MFKKQHEILKGKYGAKALLWLGVTAFLFVGLYFLTLWLIGTDESFVLAFNYAGKILLNDNKDFFQHVVENITPIFLLSLSVIFCLRNRILNFSIFGSYFLGAFTTILFSVVVPLDWYYVMLISFGVGMLLSIFTWLFKRCLKINEAITGLLLSVIAIFAVYFLLRYLPFFLWDKANNCAKSLSKFSFSNPYKFDIYGFYLPVEFVISLGLILVIFVLLLVTKWKRHLYLVSKNVLNREGEKISLVRKNVLMFFTFILSGMFASLAGCFYTLIPNNCVTFDFNAFVPFIDAFTLSLVSGLNVLVAVPVIFQFNWSLQLFDDSFYHVLQNNYLYAVRIGFIILLGFVCLAVYKVNFDWHFVVKKSKNNPQDRTEKNFEKEQEEKADDEIKCEEDQPRVYPGEIIPDELPEEFKNEKSVIYLPHIEFQENSNLLPQIVPGSGIKTLESKPEEITTPVQTDDVDFDDEDLDETPNIEDSKNTDFERSYDEEELSDYVEPVEEKEEETLDSNEDIPSSENEETIEPEEEIIQEEQPEEEQPVFTEHIKLMPINCKKKSFVGNVRRTKPSKGSYCSANGKFCNKKFK